MSYQRYGVSLGSSRRVKPDIPKLPKSKLPRGAIPSSFVPPLEAIQPGRNQGCCGCCWCFAFTNYIGTALLHARERVLPELAGTSCGSPASKTGKPEVDDLIEFFNYVGTANPQNLLGSPASVLKILHDANVFQDPSSDYNADMKWYFCMGLPPTWEANVLAGIVPNDGPAGIVIPEKRDMLLNGEVVRYARDKGLNEADLLRGYTMEGCRVGSSCAYLGSSSDSSDCCSSESNLPSPDACEKSKGDTQKIDDIAFKVIQNFPYDDIHRSSRYVIRIVSKPDSPVEAIDASSPDDVKRALLRYGAMIFDYSVYDSFFDSVANGPTKNSCLAKNDSGNIAGGHATLAFGYRDDAILVQNSWDPKRCRFASVSDAEQCTGIQGYQNDRSIFMMSINPATSGVSNLYIIHFQVVKRNDDGTEKVIYDTDAQTLPSVPRACEGGSETSSGRRWIWVLVLVLVLVAVVWYFRKPLIGFFRTR